MIKEKKIRLAKASDSTCILEIYAPYIKDTVISFEYEVPDITAFKERMANIQSRYPYLVCEVNGDIAGYAYASRHRDREAYSWSVDASVYVAPKFHRKNIGKTLYTALFEILKLQGYYNVYAGVTVPNVKSEGLHEAIGFKPVGIYHNVGYKFGRWHDVKWYELKLREHAKQPDTPKTIDEVSKFKEFMDIIEEAEQNISSINLSET